MRVCVLYDDETWGFTPAEFIAHYPCEWEMLTLSRPVFDKLKAIQRSKSVRCIFQFMRWRGGRRLSRAGCCPSHGRIEYALHRFR